MECSVLIRASISYPYPTRLKDHFGIGGRFLRAETVDSYKETVFPDTAG